MFTEYNRNKWAFFLIPVLLFFDGSHAQLAQWLSPYLPVVPAATVNGTRPGLVYRQREVLNETTGTFLEWSVALGNATRQSVITFNFTTRLTGDYVVLGLSRNESLGAADVALVRNLETNGQAEILDMYGIDNTTISLDATQNWRLDQVLRATNASGNSSSISVIISRDLDTCDGQQDIPINNDMLHVIWGTGSNLTSDINSNSSIQFTPEGNVRAYLADPVRPNIITENNPQSQRTFRISRSFNIPPRRTSYWCTIHKGPVLQQRQHIIGYAAYFSNATSEQHVHHQLVYRCVAPPGMDAALIFDRFLSHPGEECYLEQSHQLPTHLCSEILHTWGVGGKPFTFPLDVGMSIGEAQNEYFMFESHYDNPELRADLVIENGADFTYSPDIRPVEGGIIFVGSGVLGLYMTPPNTTDFTIGGQCSSQCTTEMLTGVGGGGAEILVTMLHSHATTRKIRVRHHRGNQELPWIQNDDNYDFQFQQMRHVPRPAKILPGDTVGVECVMDTTDRNGTTLSGFSTVDEMCVTFVMLDKRLGYLYCSSEYPTVRTLSRYGIQNVTWDRQLQERVINQASNPSFVGQTLKNVLDNGNLEVWTEERKRQLENEQLYSEHNAICPPVRKMTMQAYAVYFVQGISAGLIDLTGQIENNRPSTRIVDTPGGPGASANRTTTWTRPLVPYALPSQCPAI